MSLPSVSEKEKAHERANKQTNNICNTPNDNEQGLLVCMYRPCTAVYYSAKTKPILHTAQQSLDGHSAEVARPVADDGLYPDLKGPHVVIHQNPAVASGGERNHVVGKTVRSRTRVRLGQHKTEAGTAIAFNGKQLNRRIGITREEPFTNWLSGLGRPDHDMDGPTVNGLDEKEEEVAYDISEFGLIGLNGQEIADDNLFDEDVIEEVVVPLGE
jgi:hypothetical protein